MEAKCERGIGNRNGAVCVKKNTSLVGHLPLGKNGKFNKIVFYFLRAEQDAE